MKSVLKEGRSACGLPSDSGKEVDLNDEMLSHSGLNLPSKTSRSDSRAIRRLKNSRVSTTTAVSSQLTSVSVKNTSNFKTYSQKHFTKTKVKSKNRHVEKHVTSKIAEAIEEEVSILDFAIRRKLKPMRHKSSVIMERDMSMDVIPPQQTSWVNSANRIKIANFFSHKKKKIKLANVYLQEGPLLVPLKWSGNFDNYPEVSDESPEWVIPNPSVNEIRSGIPDDFDTTSDPTPIRNNKPFLSREFLPNKVFKSTDSRLSKDRGILKRKYAIETSEDIVIGKARGQRAISVPSADPIPQMLSGIIGQVLDTDNIVDASDNIRLASNAISDTVRTGIPPVVEGINSLAQSIETFSSSLDKIGSVASNPLIHEVNVKHDFMSSLGIKLPSFEELKNLIKRYVPGISKVTEWMDALDNHPQAKKVFYLILAFAVTLPLGEEAFTENGVSKLVSFALQWMIVMVSGDDDVRQFVFIQQSALVLLPQLVPTILSVISSMLAGEEIKVQAREISDKVLTGTISTFKTWLSFFAMALAAREVSSQSLEGGFLKACTVYQKLKNGLDFTVNSFSEMLIEIFGLFGQPVGYNFFRTAYNKYPEIYDIMDRAAELRDILISGKPIYTKHVEQMRSIRLSFDVLRKKIPMTSDNGVYLSQINHLDNVIKQMELIVSSSGLLGGSFKPSSYVVTLIGPPGIGKTYAKDAMLTCMAEYVIGADKMEDFKRNRGDFIHSWKEVEFHDDLRPGMRMFVFDDWGQTKKTNDPEKCVGRRLIDIVNNEPYKANMSEATKKNKVAVEPYFSVITTNVTKLSVDNFHVIDLRAIDRRMGLKLKVVVKPEFRKDDAKNDEGSMDFAKIGDSKFNPNIYTFYEYDMLRGENRGRSYEWKDLLLHIRQSYTDHMAREWLKLTELINIDQDPDVNPFLEFPLNPPPVVQMNNDAFDSAFRRFLEEAKDDEETRNTIYNATINALRNTGRPRFTPCQALFYIDHQSQRLWSLVFARDAEWAQFAQNHFRSIQEWLGGELSAVLYSQYSPTEIPANLYQQQLLLRELYSRMKQIATSTGLALIDVWNLFRTQDPRQALTESMDIMYEMLRYNARESLRSCVSSYITYFSFQGVFGKTFMNYVPICILALCSFRKIQVQGNYEKVKKVVYNKLAHKVVKITEPELPDLGEPRVNMVDIGSQISAKSMSIFASNQYALLLPDLEEKNYLFAMTVTFFKGKRALANAHLLRTCQQVKAARPDIRVIFYHYFTKQAYHIEISAIDFWPDPFKDCGGLVCSDSSGMPDAGNIIKHFVDRDVVLEAGMGVTLALPDILNKEADYTKWKTSLSRIGVDLAMTSNAPKDPTTGGVIEYTHLDHKYKYNVLVYPISTKEGDCGSFLWLTDKRYPSKVYIVGLHAAGSSTGRMGYAVPINRQYIENMDLFFDKTYHKIPVEDFSVPEEPVLHTGIPDHLIVVGLEPPVPMNTNNPIKRTKIHGMLAPCERIPTIMRPFSVVTDEGTCDHDPMFKSLTKYSRGNGPFNSDLFKKCTMMYLRKLVSIFPHCELEKLRFLNNVDVIHPWCSIEGIPRNTSVGYEYKKRGITKEMLFGRSMERDTSSVHCQQLMKEADEFMEKCKQGIVELNVYDSFGKAETLPEHKVLSGKLRRVSGVGIVKLMGEKRMLAPVVNLFMHYPIVTGTAIGINPDSPDWDLIARLLDGYGIIAGDYSGWDASMMRPEVYDALYTIVSGLYFNINDDERMALRTLLYGICKTVQAEHFHDHTALVLYYHGMASGDFATLFGNSVVNNIWGRYLMISAYLRKNDIDPLKWNFSKYPLDFEDFEKSIFVLTTGDDHFYAVRKDSQYSIIGHLDIEREVSVMGGKYTSELKNNITPPPLRDISQVMYCKMRWRWEPELGRYTAPLEIESIFNSLCWTENNEKTFTSVIDDAVCYFSKHGFDVFNKYVPILIKLSRKFYNHIPRFILHDDMYTNWLEVLYFVHNAGYKVYHGNPKDPRVLPSLGSCYDYDCSDIALMHDIELNPGPPIEGRRVLNTLGDPLRVLLAMAQDPEIQDLDLVFEISMKIGVVYSALHHYLVNLTKFMLQYDIETNPGPLVHNNKFNMKFFEDKKELGHEGKGRNGVSKGTPPSLGADQHDNCFILQMNSSIAKEVVGTTTFADDGKENAVEYESTTPSDKYSHEFATIRDFLAKPAIITNSTFTTVDTANQDVYSSSIVTLLNAQTAWTNKLQGYNLWRGTAVFKININANPFQQGYGMMRYLPDATTRSAGTASMWNSCLATKSQHPGVFFDFRDSSAELRIPYVTPYYYYDSATGLYDWGKIFITVISPLATDPSGSTSVDYTLTMWFEDFEVAAPIVPQMRRIESRVTRNPSNDEQKGMLTGKPISGALYSVAKAAKFLGGVPTLSTYAAPTAWALSKAANLASYFGYSKPAVHNTQDSITIDLNKYSACSDGGQMSLPTSLRSDNQVKILPEVSIRSEDEMSFAFLKKREAIIKTITWTDTDVSGTLLHGSATYPPILFQSFSVSAGAHTATCHAGPPAFYLSRFFNAWRGSIRIRIKIVKTAFHSGRLMITYTPTSDGGIVVPTSATSIFALREIVDIRFNDEIIIELPYLLPTAYADMGTSAGVWQVNVLNELKHPENTSDSVELIVFASAGDDFELSGPTGSRTWDNTVPFLPQMNTILEEVIGSQPHMSMDDVPSQVSFGELFQSVKQLLQRTRKIETKSAYANGQGGWLIFPWFSTISTMDATGRITPTFGGDNYCLIAPMYAFYRGGMNVGILGGTNTMVTGTIVNDGVVSGTAPIRPTGTLANFAWGLRDYGDYSLKNYGLAGTAYKDNHTAAFMSVPYYCPVRCSTVYLSDTDSSYAAVDAPDAGLVFNSQTTYGSQIAFYRSVRDDFQFSLFVCCPPILTNMT